MAVNDLGDPENMAYLLKYDTAYGKADFDVAVVPQETERNQGFVWAWKKLF